MERRQSPVESHTRTSSSTRNTRHGSGWTDDTNFTDSAVSMNAAETPPLKGITVEDEPNHQQRSPNIISQSVTDRVRQIVAAMWTLEQGDRVSDQGMQRIEKQLSSLEAVLGVDQKPHAETVQTQLDPVSATPESISLREEPLGKEEASNVDDSSLVEVHQNLADVVAAMRLRQQEQRHLHELTVTKIEAVAQRCLFQEQQLHNMVNGMKQLRRENQTLGRENDKLRDIVAELESEASKRETAVSAMTSAVAGLEGWIDDADRTKVDQRTPVTPARKHQQRRAIVRGKGRFRGRHFLDEEHDPYSDGSPDARELQDGVKAWIRGFRDVEDACSSPDPDRAKEVFRRPVGADEDDWGEFESPSNVIA